MPTDPQALADLIRERIAELSLSQGDLAKRTKEVDDMPGARPGLSIRTINDLCGGKIKEPHPRSLVLIDKALELPRGTAAAVLNGGEPPDLSVYASKIELLEGRLDRVESALGDVIALLRTQDRLSRLSLRDDELE